MFFRNQESPAGTLAVTGPLCMSFSKLGTIKATVGNESYWEGSVGKSANLRLDNSATAVPLGTLPKLIQGTCFLAYRPHDAFSPEKPILGRLSE